MTRHSCATPPDDAVVAAPPDAGSPAVRRVHRPRADCTTDSAGGLTFRVRLCEGADEEAGAPEVPESAAVLLRLRHQHGPDASLRLPLARAAADGRLQASLPSTTRLREGRWDAYLTLGDEEPQRLLPGVHDLRSLVGSASVDTQAWLGVRIPYTTKYGNLAVRTWLRRPHAEAGALRVADDAITLQGRLYGARLSATACLEAHPRDAAASSVRVPVRPDSEERSEPQAAAPEHGTDTGHSVRDFAAELPLGSLLPGHRVWDLWLRPAEDEEPVRLGRILDDIPDKKRVFKYPSQRVTSRDGAAHSARPYYTINNNLSVQVSVETLAEAEAE
ncbi:hypothetical protein [Streptomyces smyrnaeus]|uniref:hypothetical protein n=1 Tax=Streptomyces smyrnaeus TaxID=1387713 RepID=UPI001FD7C207|nr:hypothetical protein [Streptomyces smyrnaeus]